jgi:hypothetical protein
MTGLWKRWAVLAVVLVPLSVAVGVAFGTHRPPSAESIPADAAGPQVQIPPQELVERATPENLALPFTFRQQAPGLTATGQVNPGTGDWTVHHVEESDGGTVTVDVVDGLVKVTASGPAAARYPGEPDVWYAVRPEPASLPASSQTLHGPSGAAALPVVRAATRMSRLDGTRYAGVTDLTAGYRSRESRGLTFGPLTRRLGERAKAVPCTVTLTDTGTPRLASYTLDVPAAGGAAAYQLTTNYDYGLVSPPALPDPGRTRDAPGWVYDLLGYR